MASDDLPSIGFGTYKITDPEACTRSVETALEVGYRHIDTAEGYDNEAAVGEGLAASAVDREDVVVATKVSPTNLGYDDVLEHARASRDRLGVEVIDLLYVHWPLRAYDPTETLPALADLHDDGVIRHVGLSNFTPQLLTDALEHLDVPLFAHQVECHPLLPQAELRALAAEHDHTLVAYSPLARGAVFDVPELVEIADSHDATAPQVALAWLAAKDHVVAIPKSETPDHIRENYAARDLSLSDEEIDRIDAIERRERVVDFDDAPWN